MKKLRQIIMIGFILGISVSAHAEYLTKVKVTPDKVPHRFVVDFKIMQVDKNSKAKIISDSRMIVKTGEKGHAKIVDDLRENNGTFFTALVKENDTGIEATTTVLIKENGIEKLSNAQSIIFAN